MARIMDDVEALEMAPLRVTSIDVNGEWPCPFCGDTKPTDGAYSARVRNRTGPGHERWVRVCADCMSTVPRVREGVTPTLA